MRRLAGSTLVIVAVLMAGAAPASAWERGRFGHAFWGPRMFVGPLWFPPFAYPYPYPYPYYPPPVIVQPAPQVYVQPPPAPQAPPSQQYWYYCEDPKGYYPYVSQCAGGWMQVVPRAPAATP